MSRTILRSDSTMFRDYLPGWRMARNGDMWFKRVMVENDGSFVGWSYNIDVAIIEAGTHRLFIRDTTKNWSWEIVDHEFESVEQAQAYIETIARMEAA